MHKDKQKRTKRTLGHLGQTFINERMRKFTFDEALKDWKAFENTIEFIIRNPDIADYHRYDEFRKNRRLSIRRKAKSWFGKHIRSDDINILYWILSGLKSFGLLSDIKHYTKNEILNILYNCDEANCNFIDGLTDPELEYMSYEFSEFLDQHSLNQVPATTQASLFMRHFKKKMIEENT